MEPVHRSDWKSHSQRLTAFPIHTSKATVIVKGMHYGLELSACLCSQSACARILSLPVRGDCGLAHLPVPAVQGASLSWRPPVPAAPAQVGQGAASADWERPGIAPSQSPPRTRIAIISCFCRSIPGPPVPVLWGFQRGVRRRLGCHRKEGRRARILHVPPQPHLLKQGLRHQPIAHRGSTARDSGRSTHRGSQRY